MGKKTTMRAPSLTIIPGAALALCVLGLASAQAADKPFTDAVAYCQAAGNADAPDARYAGPAVPDWMVGRALQQGRDHGAEEG